MNTQNRYYENFPILTIIFRNALNIAIFLLGAVILAGFGEWVSIVYLAYCTVMMIWVMRFRCKYCYYFDKLCVAGFGKIAPLFFKKGNDEDFPKYIKYVYQLFLTYLAPLIGGIILLIIQFSLVRLVLVLCLTLIAFVFSERFMRHFGCVYCKQQEDCPAYLSQTRTQKITNMLKPFSATIKKLSVSPPKK